jgi:hypothetical protein
MTLLLPSTRRLRSLGTAVVAVAVAFPATALGAQTAGPRVIRIDAATGAKSVLAGGGPWTRLSGIAVGPSGTVYVAERGTQAKDGSYSGGGVYSLSAPGFAIKRLTTASPIIAPTSLMVSGSTLYASGNAGVSSVDTNPPFTQTLLSPERLGGFAVVGSTLYTTTAPDCNATPPHNTTVVAIDTTTGGRTQVGDLGCDYPSAMIAAPNGTLLVAGVGSNGSSTGIVRLNPATGQVTPAAAGGKIQAPAGIALTASGDLIVADGNTGVLRISGATGKQTTIASGGDFTQSGSVALDPSGNIYVTASGTVTLKATAKARQRFSSGIRVNVSCRPRCAFSYRMEFPGQSYAGTGFELIDRPGSKWTLRLKMGAETKRLLSKTLRSKRSMKVRVKLVPLDGYHQTIGKEVNLTVVLAR